MIVYMVIAMCYYTYLRFITSKGVIKHVWLWNKIFRKVFQGPKFSLKTVGGPVDQNIQKQNSSDRITCINGGIYS